MITEQEKEMVGRALQYALDCGAAKARATLNKSSENLVATLDGEIDKVTRCEDRSLSLSLFVDGRYGSFSTNKLDRDALESFIAKSVGIVRMLSEDPCRDLPDPGRCCREARTGLELGIYDKSIGNVTAEDRCRAALDASAWGRGGGDIWRLVSEEGEYSDSEYSIYIADTQGLSCMHTETSFDYGVEVTIEDQSGDKYSGWWWHAAPFASELKAPECGIVALERAAAQIGSKPAAGGKYNMVVDSDVASKMVSPLLSALNGYSIQQNNSFLVGSLGKRVLPEGLTIMDLPRLKGETGSKLFDSEGVAADTAAIVEKGVVKRYFINTYMSGKLQMEPTIEEAIRPKVCGWPREGLTQKDILGMCGSGILVTEFNGGNSNSATGDFSYGVEGFLFEDGKPVRPVSGMLVTGNYLTLWQNLIAAGGDARSCMSKLIPTLAFSKVDFSG